MGETTRRVSGIAASFAMLAAGAVPATQAMAQEDVGPLQASGFCVQQVGAEGEAATVKTVDHVEGTFAYTQGEVADNASIARHIYKAANVLCGSGPECIATGQTSALDAAQWTISIGGDVQNAFSATMEELCAAGPFQQVLGCSCAGNPADGRASANARVAGFTLASLLEKARPCEGANTITFVSQDGYKISLPLAYVTQRASVIVYEMNGELMADSMGAANQLWLGSTSARYFAQNVVEVLVTAEDEVPAAPGAGSQSEGANLPNVSLDGATA